MENVYFSLASWLAIKLSFEGEAVPLKTSLP